MSAVLIFAVVLLVAAAISGLARRSILSTAVLFLVAGYLVGAGGLGILTVRPSDPAVSALIRIALFSVLFTDGMRAGVDDLRGAWRLPGRLLFVGMPITFALTGVLAHTLGGLAWSEALLVAAALAPTDPVLASAIVGRQEVPPRVRHLLNVESGLNDGLALPIVVIMVDVVASRPVDAASLVLALVGGVALGIVVPLLAFGLFAALPIEVSEQYEALAPVAIGMAVFSAAELTGANPFLAAFAAGSTIASTAPTLRRAFTQFGELTTELFKLAALLVFGTLVTAELLGGIGIAGAVFCVLTLTAARAVAVAVALVGKGLPRTELVTIGWFGPKGFASVAYALLILSADVGGENLMFALIAATVALSIVAHSSTDVAVAHRFAAEAAWTEQEEEAERPPRSD